MLTTVLAMPSWRLHGRFEQAQIYRKPATPLIPENHAAALLYHVVSSIDTFWDPASADLSPVVSDTPVMVRTSHWEQIDYKFACRAEQGTLSSCCEIAEDLAIITDLELSLSGPSASQPLL